ncbi:MAG: hypothetical protein IJ643_05165 [Eubacterium sp.]|nr:hypothetical protein [Eubacterium sp.]
MDRKVLSAVEQYINIVKTINQDKKPAVINNKAFENIIQQVKCENGEKNEKNN